MLVETIICSTDEKWVLSETESDLSCNVDGLTLLSLLLTSEEMSVTCAEGKDVICKPKSLADIYVFSAAAVLLLVLFHGNAFDSVCKVLSVCSVDPAVSADIT